MKKFLIIMLLLASLGPAASFGERPFDIEEYGSADELATALVRVISGESPARSGIENIRLALLPTGTARTDVFSAVSKRLTATESLWVLPPAEASAFIRRKRDAGPSLISEMIRTFGLDLVVTVREHFSEGKALVLVRIFFSDQSKSAATLAGFVPSVMPKPWKPGAQGAENAQWSGFPSLPVNVRYFEYADLDGDGVREYIFSNGEMLSVYRLEPSGWRLVWTEQHAGIRSRPRHISLSAADVNGDGRSEVFVTGMEKGIASSYISEYRGAELVRVAETTGFLRPVPYPGKEALLLGQGFSESGFYAGVPKEYKWDGKGYVQGHEFVLPKGVALFGTAFADFGELSLLLVTLDEKGRFRIFSGDNAVWESQERYGAVETVAVESSGDIYDIRQRAVVMAGIELLDIDHDGKDEVLVPRNIGATVFKPAKEAEMHILSWTGARLEETGRIKGLPGPALDYQVVRRDESDIDILVLVQTEGGSFSGPASRLMRLSLK